MINYRSAKVTATGNVGAGSRLDLDTPASATEQVNLYIGDDGMRFENVIHATLTNVTSLTCIFA
jgi:hypothetical protein